MLKEAGDSSRYWVESLNFAVYIRNRLPTQALDKQTPFECLLVREPDLNVFRVFGFQACVFVDEFKRKQVK